MLTVDCCVLGVCRFQVFVKGLVKTITIDLAEGKRSVFDLYIGIQLKTNIDPKDQHLQFAGKSMPHIWSLIDISDKFYFKDIGINANSTIHLSSFLRGGMDAGAG